LLFWEKYDFVVTFLPGEAMKTDAEIKKDVLAELLWDPLISGTKVGVSVNATR